MTIYTYPRSSTPVPDPAHPTQSLYTRPRCSLSTVDLPDQFQYLSPTQAPSHPSQPISNTSNALHTHKSLQCLYQTLHTPLKPLTPIPSPPDPIKALHIHFRPSVLILGPQTLPYPVTPTLGPPPSPRPSSPSPVPPYSSQTFPTTLCHPDQFQVPLHTHPNPFTSI